MQYPTANKNVDLIISLQQKLVDAVRAVCPVAEDYALLDFPNHSNVGDSAIYIGELLLLEKLYGKGPAFVMETSRADLDLLPLKVPSGPIFLHGGGNFGDIWPKYQAFREHVIERFPDREIIQLPQTIHFSNTDRLRQSANIANRHRNFSLLVRDNNSRTIAEENFSGPVHLCPDSALMIGPLQDRRPPVTDIFCLIRTDKESAADHATADAAQRPDIIIDDWLVEPQMVSGMQKLQRKAIRIPIIQRQALDWRKVHYNDWAHRRLERGLDMLSSGRLVITDRLHAHILSFLMGKPHVALDNSYGKISSFIEAWTKGGDFASASCLSDALRVAEIRQNCGSFADDRSHPSAFNK